MGEAESPFPCPEDGGSGTHLRGSLRGSDRRCEEPLDQPAESGLVKKVVTPTEAFQKPPACPGISVLLSRPELRL